MQIINRDLLVITPREACVNWANGLDEGFELSAEDMSGHDTASTYLIPEFEDEHEALSWMSSDPGLWFALLLQEWTSDETKWPEDQSWENLNRFFEISYQSLIYDMVDEDVEKYEEDEENEEDED